MISSTIGSSVIVLLTADFLQLQIYRTTRDVHSRLIASLLPVTITRETSYVSADHEYDDDHELLYDLSTDMGFQLLVCPVQRYENTTAADRIKLVEIYESKVGQAIYSLRGKSIEPLIEHIKSVFRIDPLPVRGYDRACAIVLLSVLLLYQIYLSIITVKLTKIIQEQSNTC